MISTRVLFSALAAVVSLSTAEAFTGRASWDSPGTTFCMPPCPPSEFRVALPPNLYSDGARCCQSVEVTYEERSIRVQFTDLFYGAAGSENISLSRQAFDHLAPLTDAVIFPVDWIFVS